MENISILPYVYVISSFGTIFNALLIIAFIKDPLKCFRNSGTYLVANLAVSDFTFCCISLLFLFLPKHLLLAFENSLDGIASVSVITLASISLDRFLMVIYPMKYRVWMKGKIIIIWLLCIWLLSTSIAISFFFHFPADTLFFLYLLAPVIAILSSILYGFTYINLRRQSRNFALQNTSDRQQRARIMKEKRFLSTIIFIAVLALVCIVPSLTFQHFVTSQRLSRDNLVVHTLNSILTGVFSMNFAVNPLVYVLRLPNYRKTFYLVYCCKTITPP